MDYSARYLLLISLGVSFYVPGTRRAVEGGVPPAVIAKGVEVVTDKLVDKQLKIIDEAQDKAANFLKKEIKLDIVPDKGWKSEDMFVPAGYHIGSTVTTQEAPKKEIGELPYVYPAGLGAVMMNGCWGSGYKETDPCYTAKQKSTRCTNMIDGAAFMGVGFDGRGDYSPDSRKMSIIQRNCAGKDSYDGFDVPDTMNVHGVYETSANIHTFSGRAEYQTYLQTEAGTSGSLFGFSAGVKKAWGESSAGASQQHMSVLDVDVDRYEIFMEEVKPEDLNLSFLKEFMALPTSYFTVGAPLKYQDFIQRWGTHFIKSAKFGGRLEIRKTMDASDVQSKKEFAVEMEMEYKTLFASVSAKKSTKSGSSQREQKKTTSTSIVAQGGSQEIASILSDVYSTAFKNEFKQWLQTIPTYPKAFQFYIGSISELVNFRASELFPGESVSWGCEGNAATVKTEKTENGDEAKYYETENGNKTKTKHYCEFDSRQGLEDAIKRRRTSLNRAIEVYMEEGPISISDVRLPACKYQRDTPSVHNDLLKASEVPSWKQITKEGLEFKVDFDMNQDLIGVENHAIAKNMSCIVRYRLGRWFTSGEDGIFHLYNAFPDTGKNEHSKQRRLSIQGLWVTYEERDGSLTLSSADLAESKKTYPELSGRLSGVPIAAAALDAGAVLKRSSSADEEGPCNVQWSNALRFDPTDREGKCIHFTAATSGPIYVVFATLPKDTSSWYYVKITGLKVEIYKGNTMKTSTVNTNARALGDASLLQSYFVCISESVTSTLVEYGKTLGSEDTADIYLNMADNNQHLNVRFYAFGNGRDAAQVMDAHVVPRHMTKAECKGDTFKDTQTNLCVQKCHIACDPLAGCKTTESGNFLPTECNECRVARHPLLKKCVSECPLGTEPGRDKICVPSFELKPNPRNKAWLEKRGFIPELPMFSICLWLKLKGKPTFGTNQPWFYILGYQGPEETDHIGLHIELVQTHLALMAEVGTRSGRWMYFNELKDNRWHHACVTWSGLTGVVKSYKNGEKSLEQVKVKRVIGGGGRMWIRMHGPAEFLISELNVWDRVLTDQEIAASQGSCGAMKGNVKTWLDFFPLMKPISASYNSPSTCKPRRKN